MFCFGEKWPGTLMRQLISKFFLSLDQSCRSKKLGMGSGLVTWFPVDLEKCVCVLFHSYIVHGWDGKLTPTHSFHVWLTACLNSRYFTHKWVFRKSLPCLSFLLTDKDISSPPLPSPSPWGFLSFLALLMVLYHGRLFLSDFSFSFVRSIECNASRHVFIEIFFSPFPILPNIKTF